MTSPGVRFGRFRLLEPLGEGGMAEVWLARVEGAGGIVRDVVIKRIISKHLENPEFAALFAREARLSARLRHANIVQVFEYGEVEGDPYLAMEYIEGVDLHRLLSSLRKEGKVLSPALASYIARELARALEHVHGALDDAGQPMGLVHRDISPSNVLLSVDGTVKLVDFGIARGVDERPLTATGSFRGKISYSAPEVVDGRPHDARSDVFALGIVLYEMLSGQRLFVGETDAQTFGLVHAAVVKPLSDSGDVPPALDAVCLRALARLPGDRTESAQQFIREIDPVVRELQAGPEQLAELVRSVPRKKKNVTPLARTVPSRLEPVAESSVAVPAMRRPLLIMLAAVTLAFGLSGALFLSRPVVVPPRLVTAPVVVAPPVVLPPVVKAPTPEHFAMRSVPSGATVKDDQGRVLGVTPLEVDWLPSERPARLVLEHAGYERVRVEVPSGDELSVTLKVVKKPARPNLKKGAVVNPFK